MQLQFLLGSCNARSHFQVLEIPLGLRGVMYSPTFRVAHVEVGNIKVLCCWKPEMPCVVEQETFHNVQVILRRPTVRSTARVFLNEVPVTAVIRSEVRAIVVQPLDRPM